MPKTVAHQLIESHLVSGTPTPGAEIALLVDQTLTQDATGTTVMLELEAMGLDRVRTEVSVQYVDHNLLQTDERNPEDHLFLRSACRRFGLWYSKPGNGVSHPLHMQRFGIPGKTLAGSDSHTCAAGALGIGYLNGCRRRMSSWRCCAATASRPPPTGSPLARRRPTPVGRLIGRHQVSSLSPRYRHRVGVIKRPGRLSTPPGRHGGANLGRYLPDRHGH
jgi:hypothetical protein